MDLVGQLIKELEENPRRFRATGGYERLLDLLRNGCDPDAVRRILGGETELAGHLLWTVTELENVAPFVSAAARHLSSEDKGTAAYAMEVVFRGSRDPDELRAAFEQLRQCDVAVCEHAVRVLAGEGLDRLIGILESIGPVWGGLAEELSRGRIRRGLVGGLISDTSRDRQVVGVILATLASERDRSFISDLKGASEIWIREYGEWLRSIHRS